MNLPLLVIVSIIFAASAGTGCPPGKFPWGASCMPCDGCVAFPDTCKPSCLCPSETSSCQTPNAMGFCGLFDTKKGSDGDGYVQSCLTCLSSCDSHDPGHQTVLSTTDTVPGYSACPKTCVCSAHSECGTDTFCGTSASSSNSLNLCRSCSSCMKSTAIGGSCPREQCASSFQCDTDSDCTKSGAWCSKNYQCMDCLGGACYIKKSERSSFSKVEFSSQDGTCPKSCCGWNTMPASDYENGHMSFSVGACDSEKYVKFLAMYVKDATKSTVVSPAGTNTHSCTLDGVDENSNGYPRQVPYFTCKIIGNCTSANVTVAVFGVEEDGTVKQLHSQYYELNTSNLFAAVACGIGDAIAKALLIILLCSLGACVLIVGCCVFACCAASRRKTQLQPQVVQYQQFPAAGVQVVYEQPPQQVYTAAAPAPGAPSYGTTSEQQAPLKTV